MPILEDRPDGPAPEVPVFHLRHVVKELREQRGLSQQDLADKAGVSKGAISNLEAGNTEPSLDILRKIAAGLGYDAGTLLSLGDKGELPVGGAVSNVIPLRRATDRALPPEVLAFAERYVQLNRLAQTAILTLILAFEESGALKKP